MFQMQNSIESVKKWKKNNHIGEITELVEDNKTAPAPTGTVLNPHHEKGDFIWTQMEIF